MKKKRFYIKYFCDLSTNHFSIATSITIFTCWIKKKDDFEIRNSLSSVTQVWSGEYLSVISCGFIMGNTILSIFSQNI